MMPRPGCRPPAPSARQRRLRELLVERKTLQRYELAVGWFMQWCLLVGLGTAQNFEELDWQLSEYLEFLWEQDQRRGLAGDTLSGVSHYANAKRKIPFSWRLLAAWQRNEVPVRAPPMSRLMALAIAGAAALDNDGWFALSILVGFHAFLRTTELLTLTVGQVILSPTTNEVVLDLGYTKSGKRRGARELVVLDEPVCASLLRMAVAGRDPTHLLVGCTPTQWRQKFAKYCEAAGLAGFELKPYSLRRGGATAFFMLTGSISLALERGRWGQSATARIYLTEGRVACQNFAVPLAMAQRLHTLAAVWQW